MRQVERPSVWCYNAAGDRITWSGGEHAVVLQHIATRLRRRAFLPPTGPLDYPQLLRLAEPWVKVDNLDLGPNGLALLQRTRYAPQPYLLSFCTDWPEEIAAAAHLWQRWILICSVAGARLKTPGHMIGWPLFQVAELWGSPICEVILLGGWLLLGEDATPTQTPQTLAARAGIPELAAVRWLLLSGVEGWQEAG